MKSYPRLWDARLHGYSEILETLFLLQKFLLCMALQCHTPSSWGGVWKGGAVKTSLRLTLVHLYVPRI